MSNKILIFETYNSLDYWFKVIRSYLGNQQYQYFAVEDDRKKIIINNQELRFITYPLDHRKFLGLRPFKIYTGVEETLERNYSKTILEILEEKVQEKDYCKTISEILEEKVYDTKDISKKRY